MIAYKLSLVNRRTPAKKKEKIIIPGQEIHHHHGRGDYAACRVISPPMKNIPYILFNTFLPYISIRWGAKIAAKNAANFAVKNTKKDTY